MLDIESLYKPFDAEDVKCGLKKLNQSKAPGIKSLTSKMLKWSNYNLLKEPKKYFYFVLDSGYYPENWNHGNIYIIYKSGPKYHPWNYRGITLTIFLENSLALSYILGLRMKWKRTNYYPNPK